MEKNQKNIQFTVIENEQRNQIKVVHGSYPNLMFLLKEELGLDSFGECGGVGRCATCVIEAVGIKGTSSEKDRNEPTTLVKMGYTSNDIRLSCQLYITPDLEGCEITILNL